MKLLEKVILGGKTLKNALAMAPMTRSRAESEGVVSDLTTLYYTQRASAGLLITEAINISEQALGSPLTPGLYSDEQIEAWKKVTNPFMTMEVLSMRSFGIPAVSGILWIGKGNFR